MTPLQVEWLGDRALLLLFGDSIDRDLNNRVHRAARHVHAAHIPGVTEIVPGYASLCIHYDPASLGVPGVASRDALVESLCRSIGDDSNSQGAADSLDAPEIEIPVCYGGRFGPDLREVARHAGIDEADVIALHAAGAYRVAMIGFAPGFPYLLGLDPRLQAPRLAQPRTRVPAGAVAIGGAQTGIYPRELPGGWRIIGQTPLVLFDAGRATPALLSPGQRVHFRAIDAQGFAKLSR